MQPLNILLQLVITPLVNPEISTEVILGHCWTREAIVSALPVERLKDLFSYAKKRGLDVLVEVHDEAEMQTAIELGADIVGVNNRNLADFSVSLETTVRLAANVPEHVVLVSESGIRSSFDAEQVRVAGAKAILVGEALMKAADPSAAIKEFSISRTGAG